MEKNEPPAKRSNLTLWLVLAVCVAPFAAAIVVHRYFPPESRMNYGELIEPMPLPEAKLDSVDGKPFPLSALRGKWIMVHIDSAACAATCIEKAWKIRQVRLTQGEKMDRIERLWLINDSEPVSLKIQSEYKGMHMLRATPEIIRQLPAREASTAHIWLIDPLGNIMLRYDRDADPSGMKKDLLRLLRVSRIG